MRARRIAIITAAAAVIVAIGAMVAWGATTSSSSSYGWGMMGGRYVYRPVHETQVRTLPAARAEAQKFADRLGLRVDEVLQFKRNFYAKLVDSQGNGATEVLVDPSTGVVSIEYGPAMMWNTKYGMGRAAQSMMGSYGRGMTGRGYGGMMTGPSGGSGTTGAYGPGMMGGAGNGYSGMMGGNGNAAGNGTSSGSSTYAQVTLAKAHSLAQRWLDQNERGVKVETGGDAFPGYYTLETLRGGRMTGMISVNATSGAVWPHWWHGEFVAKSE